MTKEQAIERIYEFEQNAAKDFAVTSDLSAFVAASEKVKRNLAGFGITVDEYAAYASQRQSVKPKPRGFFTDRPKLPDVKDIDAILASIEAQRQK